MIALAIFAAWSTQITPYQWRNIKIGGGGFVSGIITHPKKAGLVYARTDIGGAYRWDSQTKRWIPLQDWLTRPDWNLYGVESLAVDPNDPNRIYIAAGTYTNDWGHNGAILRSADLGKTWDRIDLPFKNGGNMPGRSIGERLMVDPQDGRVLYFGTRDVGLYRSGDRGATWTQVRDFGPVPTNDIGVGWIVFDPKGGAGPTKRLFAGVEGADFPVRESSDAGKTWHAVAGQPEKLLPMQAKLGVDGKLIVVYSDFWGPNDVHTGAVYSFDIQTGEWTDITPEKPGPGNTFGYAGVTLDAKHPKVVMVSTLCRWSRVDTVFRTTDGGKSWVSLGDKATRDTSETPFLNWDRDSANFGHWIGDVEIDPFNPNRAWYVTGATIYSTDNLQAADANQPTRWRPLVDGIEETAAIKLVSPPEGAEVVSALGDICGFRHDDLTKSPPGGMWRNPTWSTTNDLDFAGQKPNVFIRVGWNGGPNGALSEDGCKTWRPFATDPPGAHSGSAAISADGQTIVWSPNNMAPWVSHDGAKSWKKVGGLIVSGRVLSDKSDPKWFYIEAGGAIYTSRDGGDTFSKGADGFSGDLGRLNTPLGRPGDLWYPTAKGLMRSTNGGGSFERIPTLDSAEQVGFGKGDATPMIFVIGVLEGVPGVYRSADGGKTWSKINGPEVGLATMDVIAGDPKRRGRVYLGTNGRGIWVADPVER